jgi:hypothetical protein
MNNNLPKYTAEKQKGNIGEALVQYLLSDFCLVHKIDGSNDVGNDFICELIRDQSPTNLLFYVQVKYTKRKPFIKKETLEYWKTSPIPVFVFWIKDKPRIGSSLTSAYHFENVEKKYKRYTPVIHKERRHNNEDYKVFDKKDFLRDLIIDYARTQYKKGFAPVVKPRDFLTIETKMEIGFPQYQLLIRDVIPEYTEDIIKGGWSNLFALAVSLCKKDNISLGERETAKKLLIISKDLLSRDEEIDSKESFISLINEHINNLETNNNSNTD